MTRCDGAALLLQPLAHVNAVCDAVSVGDDERRSIVGFRLEECLHRLCIVRAEGDARHVDMSIGKGEQGKVLLGRWLSGCCEACDSGPRSCLRGLPARI